MKKYRNILRAFVIIIFILNILPVIVLADTNENNKKDFETKVTYGFNKYYKNYLDIQTPVKVEIKNNLKDVEGEVQVLFEKDRYDQKVLYEAYIEELDLKKGATKTIDINVLMSGRRGAILKIVDSKEKVLFEQKINFEKGDDIRNISIGVLSDNYDSLSFLNSIRLDKNSSSIDKKTTSMADLNDVFPEDKDLLRSLNMILINDYDTENLNEKQIEALKGYIQEGGTLVVGTGSKYQKNLKGLEDINYFNPIKTSRIDGYGGVLIAEGEVDGVKAFLTEKERSVAYNKKLQNGNIIILGFDLAEDKFLNWGEKNNFIKKIIDDYTKVEVDGDIEKRESNNLENMVSYIPNSDGVKGKSIVFTILIFLIVAGPINYLVLKKLDKSEKAWITIPFISLVFTIAIYMVGIGTRFDDPMSNNAAIIQINNKGEVIDSLVATGVFGFKEGDLNVSFDENTSINLNPNNVNDINPMKFNDKDTIAKYNLGKQKNIEFKKIGRWESKTINSSKAIDDIDIKVQDLKIDNKGIKGKIKNNSDLNIEDAVLIYGGTHHKLGNIDKKFTQDIEIDSNKLKKSSSSSVVYEIVENIYPWRDEMYNQNDILSESAKRTIIEEALFQYIEQDSDMSMIIAWNKEAIIDDIEINGKKPSRVDRNLIIIPLDIEYKTGQEVVIPEGVFKPTIEELNYLDVDPYSRELHGDGNIIYSLKPNENIALESMEINISTSPDVSLYIYSYDKDKWEESDKNKLVIDENNIGIYYREEKGVKIKFEAKAGKDNIISPPSFSIKGVGK